MTAAGRAQTRHWRNAGRRRNQGARGLEAGRRIAEICMAVWAGSVDRQQGTMAHHAVVTANDPYSPACSQYAGWSLSSGTGKTRFHALGRDLRARWPSRSAVRELDIAISIVDLLVLEVDATAGGSGREGGARLSSRAGAVTIVLTPTNSLAVWCRSLRAYWRWECTRRTRWDSPECGGGRRGHRPAARLLRIH